MRLALPGRCRRRSAGSRAGSHAVSGTGRESPRSSVQRFAAAGQRSALRPDLPVPRHHGRRDRHDLQEHDRLARPARLRARHGKRRPLPNARQSAVHQRRDQVSKPHRDRHPGRNIPLISENADGTTGSRTGRHRGSLRRRADLRQSPLLAGASPISQETRETSRRPADITHGSHEQPGPDPVSPLSPWHWRWPWALFSVAPSSLDSAVAPSSRSTCRSPSPPSYSPRCTCPSLALRGGDGSTR